jgi:hypothetical protein
MLPGKHPVDSGFPRCSVLSGGLGGRGADIDGERGLPQHHQPTGYWEIIKRDNPCKSARHSRTAPTTYKTNLSQQDQPSAKIAPMRPATARPAVLECERDSLSSP